MLLCICTVSLCSHLIEVCLVNPASLLSIGADKILSKLGEGTFGQVLECWDRLRRCYVAIKIVRNIQKYRDAAMIELEVLHTIAKHDGNKWCEEWQRLQGDATR